MCGSSKTTTSSQTQTTTPSVPSWIEQPYEDYAGQVSNIADTDPYSLVVGATPLQNQAFYGAANLSDDPGGNFSAASAAANAATTAPAPTVNPILIGAQTMTPTTMTAATVAPVTGAAAASGLDNLQAWENPYTDEVVNTTLADMDQSDAMTRAQQAAQAAGSNAFGGSRYAVQQGVTAGQQAMARASTDAGLRNQAFNTAANYSSQDAERATQVSIANASASNQAALAQANLNQQASTANMSAQNQAAQANMNAQNASTLADQNAFDTSADENAGFANDADNRDLAAAGVLGTLGAAEGTLAANNVNTEAAQGAAQRGIDTQYLDAPLALAQAVGQLYGQIPTGQFAGKTTTSDGTSAEEDDPGILGDLTGIAKLVTGLPSDIAGLQSVGNALGIGSAVPADVAGLF